MSETDAACERCGTPAGGCHLLGYRTANYYGHMYLCRSCHIELLPDPQVVYPRLVAEQERPSGDRPTRTRGGGGPTT